MNRKAVLTIGFAAAAWVAVLRGRALSAEDKYTVKVPGGLAFAEFKGYESWETVSISRSDKVMAVIVGNPEMIAAYKAGIPANGQPVMTTRARPTHRRGRSRSPASTPVSWPRSHASSPTTPSAPAAVR